MPMLQHNVETKGLACMLNVESKCCIWHVCQKKTHQRSIHALIDRPVSIFYLHYRGMIVVLRQLSQTNIIGQEKILQVMFI